MSYILCGTTTAIHKVIDSSSADSKPSVSTIFNISKRLAEQKPTASQPQSCCTQLQPSLLLPISPCRWKTFYSSCKPNFLSPQYQLLDLGLLQRSVLRLDCLRFHCLSCHIAGNCKCSDTPTKKGEHRRQRKRSGE